MKKIFSLLLICALFTQISCAEDLSPNVTAACLISADTGEILYQDNADTPMPNASTTKILTALIVLEDMNLDDVITTPEDFVNPGGTHIAINENEEFFIRDLVYAMLIESANDASVALAIAHSGSVDAFLEIMNARAKEMGAVSSNFATVNGLHDDAHLVAAKDMAIIAAKAMHNPQFREIVKTTTHTIAPTNKQPEPRNYIHNKNLFLLNNGGTMTYNGETIRIYDERIEGVKTGYTPEAQNCLVTSIKVEGSRYISVIFGAADKDALYGTSKRLLDYATESFQRVKIIGEGEVVTNIKVKGAESTGLNLVSASTVVQSLPKNTEEISDIAPEILIDENYPNPIKMGAVIGKAVYSLTNDRTVEVQLLAQRDIAARHFVGDLTEALSAKGSFRSWQDIAIVLAKLLLTFIIWRSIIMTMRRRRAKQVRQEKLKELRAEYKKTPLKSNVVKFKPRKK